MKISELVGLEDVLRLMLDAVCVVDRRGHFLFVSAAFEKIFGYSEHEVIGKPMIDFVHPDDRVMTLRTVESLMEGIPEPRFENRWIRKDGRVVHLLWSARWSADHQVRIAVAHDITERKQMELRLQHMAGHDHLTGLPNRALLMDRIQTALTQARRDQTHLSLLFIDIDDFKEVNDNHGHPAGDELLRLIAQRLLSCVRESDTVSRLGGDEFLILITGDGILSDVLKIAEKIRAELALPFALGSLQLQISPSIGIAQYPEHGDDYKKLIQQADKAMYRAKKAGGNQFDVYK